MTTTDWIIDLVLIAIVLRQIREERITPRFLLIPLGIVSWTAMHYLNALPTAGNDLVLIALCLAGGIALGIAGGLTTHIRAEGGHAYVRAGRAAATIWIASMTARLGFIIYITHSAGQAWLTNFSVAHDITTADTWQTGLVVLALSEVIVRLGTIMARAQHAKAVATSQPTSADTLVAA